MDIAGNLPSGPQAAGTNVETAGDASVSAPASDERRMQVRAYNFWAGLLGDKSFPDIADLDPASLPDFGPRSVLLDFTEEGAGGSGAGGAENPAIAYLGALLARECGGDRPVRRLQDVPGGSLLSRITDHYMQILANEAPVGFEAEFVDHRGVNVLYRGILMPFSRDGRRIDCIYGVMNWKQGPASVAGKAGSVARDGPPAMLRPADPLTTWADGPADLAVPDFALPLMYGHAPPDLPLPGFAFDAAPAARAVAAREDAALADCLASARERARLAAHVREHSHQALYEAVSQAYDFALAAWEAPQDFAGLVAAAGLKPQRRAPLLPLVKLVFGADYDRTRLTEFAAVITHARRIGLRRGALCDHLAAAPGGLEAMVREARAAGRPRLDATGDAAADVRRSIAAGLRAIAARPLADLPCDGEEFTLLVARRLESGEVVLVGEVADDTALFQRAAKRLLR